MSGKVKKRIKLFREPEAPSLKLLLHHLQRMPYTIEIRRSKMENSLRIHLKRFHMPGTQIPTRVAEDLRVTAYKTIWPVIVTT